MDTARKVWVVCYKNGVSFGTLYYDEIDERVTKRIETLSSYKIEMHDRVVVKMKNSIEAILTYLALYEMNVTVVPVHHNESPFRLQFVLRDVGATGIIADDGYASIDTEPVESIFTEHVDTIMYTSGTTGTPKGVCLTKDNWQKAGEAIIQHFNFSEETVYATSLPLFHSYAHGVGMFATRIARAKLILCDSSNDSFLNILTTEQATVAGITPVMAYRWLRTNPHYSPPASLLYFIVAGSSLPSVLATTIYKDWGVKMIQAYGQTETTHLSTAIPPFVPVEEFKQLTAPEVSIGISLQGFLHKIGSIDAKEGEVGELCVKSNSCNSIGYWGVERHGEWIQSGDLALYKMVNGEKYFYIKGRIKEIINRNGLKFSPIEIENEVLPLGFTSEFAIIGIPDEEAGEDIALVCTFAGDVALGSQFPKYIAPKRIFLVTSLARTETGKVQRSKILEYIISHPECEVVTL